MRLRNLFLFAALLLCGFVNAQFLKVTVTDRIQIDGAEIVGLAKDGTAITAGAADRLATAAAVKEAIQAAIDALPPGEGSDYVLSIPNDSVFVFLRDGVEVSRDTVRGGGGGGVSSAQLAQNSTDDRSYTDQREVAIRDDFPVETDDVALSAVNSETNARIAADAILQADIDSKPVNQISITGVSSLDNNYAFIPVFLETFSDSLNRTVAFNSGGRSLVAEGLQVTGSGAARGVSILYDAVEGQDYFLRVVLSSVSTAGVRLTSEWADDIEPNLGSGTHEIYWTQPVDGGGNNRLTFTVNEASSFVMESIEIYLMNDRRSVVSTNDLKINGRQLKNTISQDVGYLVNNNFDDDLTGVTAFNSTPLLSDLSYAEVTGTGLNVMVFAANQFRDTVTIEYRLEIQIVDGSVKIAPVWANDDPIIVTTSGTYTGKLRRSRVQTNTALDGFVLYGEDGVTVRCLSVSLREIPDENLSYLKFLHLGRNIDMAEKSGFMGIGGKISNPLQSGNHIAIGNDQSLGGADWTRLFNDGQYTSGESVSIGNSIFNASARNTGVGEEHVLVGQSSSGIGSGIEGYTSHGFLGGRGAYLGYYPHQTSTIGFSTEMDGAIMFEGYKLYGRNGYCHRTPEPISDQSRSARSGGAGNAFEIHGLDAFDARHPLWSSSFNYERTDVVWYSNASWIALEANVGNTPNLQSTAWIYWNEDNQGAASEFSVAGDDLSLFVGRATDTEESGSINLYVAGGSNGPNVKDTPIKAAELRSEEGLTQHTYLFLLDVSTGALKRVKIGAEGSGPNGVGKALFVD